MKTKLLIKGAFISVVLFFACALLAVYAWLVNPDPREHHVSLGFYVAAVNLRGPRLVVFSDAVVGPYTGGTVDIFRPGSKEKPTVENDDIDLPGIYFRTLFGQRRTWTLILSLWYPLLIFGVLP